LYLVIITLSWEAPEGSRVSLQRVAAVFVTGGSVISTECFKEEKKAGQLQPPLRALNSFEQLLKHLFSSIKYHPDIPRSLRRQVGASGPA